MRRSATIRNRSLIALPIVTAMVALDLAVSGWGKFPNPVFYGKWAVSARSQKRLSDIEGINPSDHRLTACKEELTANTLISNHQAALRDTLTGKSAVLAVQQLGTPVCQVADGSWRWLTESGLSLDLSFDEQGGVDEATLTP